MQESIGTYTALRKTVIIFICTFDPFHDGRHLYTFENICCENTAISLGDETTKIFLNTKGTLDDVDSAMVEFLTYIEHTTDAFAKQASSPLIKEIHQKVTQVKQNKEMEVEYMTLFLRDRENIEIGREEGREEGIAQAAKIIRLYTKGCSCTEIVNSLHLSDTYVKSVIDTYENED